MEFNRCFGGCQPVARPVCQPMCHPYPYPPMGCAPQPKAVEVVTPEKVAMPMVAKEQMKVAPQMVPAYGQFESTQRIVEPAVSCSQQYHHHHRVEHIVPVVVKNVHHHHNHHDYIVDKKECSESFNYDHCLRNEDWCAIATGQPGCCR
ncbi:MAG TPA: hypothetical protein DCY20_03615 [Firmicutes bacterium]|nr:hypothetical protein [Bacillota bacterium]